MKACEVVLAMLRRRYVTSLRSQGEKLMTPLSEKYRLTYTVVDSFQVLHVYETALCTNKEKSFPISTTIGSHSVQLFVSTREIKS